MKKKYVFIVGILLLVFVLWGTYVILKNVKYNQNSSIINVDMHEKLVYGTAIYSIEDAILYDMAAFVDTYKELPWASPSFGPYLLAENQKILVYTLQVTVEDSSEQETSIIPLETRDKKGFNYNIGLDDTIYSAINNSSEIDFQKNSTIALQIPMIIDTEFLSEEDIKLLVAERMALEVVIAYQPSQYSINLNEVEYRKADNEQISTLYYFQNKRKSLIDSSIDYNQSLEKSIINEGNQGEFHDLLITVNSAQEWTENDVKEFAESKLSEYQRLSMENNLYDTYYYIEFEIENISQNILSVDSSIFWLKEFQEEKYLGGAHIFYSDIQNQNIYMDALYSEQNGSELWTLMPNEEYHFSVVLMGYFRETSENAIWYFTVGADSGEDVLGDIRQLYIPISVDLLPCSDDYEKDE